MTHVTATAPTGWGLVAMMVAVLLFVALSASAFLRLSGGGRRRGGARHSSAGRRLAERLARGEIDEASYRHLTNALNAATAGRRGMASSQRGPRRRR